MKQKSRDENSDEDTDTIVIVHNTQNTHNYDRINGTKLLNYNEKFLDERPSKSENEKCSVDHLNNGTKEILEKGKNEVHDMIADNLSSALAELTVGTENHTELNRAFSSLKLGNQQNQQEQGEPCKQLPNRNELPGTTKDNLEQKVSDSFVKLSAPSFDDNEEEEEEEEQTVPVGQEALEERGPMNGVPSFHATESVNTLPPHQQGFQAANYQLAMPPNFPDYSSHNTWKVPSKGPKRVSEEFTYEPPKYVRPFNNGIPDMNNLNEPGHTQNIYPGNLKTINQVSRTQMSGATVIAQGMVSQASANHSYTANLAEDDLVPVGFTNDETLTYLGQSDNWFAQEADAFQPQTVQINQYRHWNIGPDSRGGCDDFSDNGYGSDFSPQNDSHSSPLPSPPSVCAASVSLSPPPSNDSVDSGVHSPPLADLYNAANQGQSSEYHSKYIDDHPELFLDSLIVVQDDLKTMAERRKPDQQVTSSTLVHCPLPPITGTRVPCPLSSPSGTMGPLAPPTGIMVYFPLPPPASTVAHYPIPPPASTIVHCPVPPPASTMVHCPVPPPASTMVHYPVPPAASTKSVACSPPTLPKQPSPVFVPPPATGTSPHQAPPNKRPIPRQQNVVVVQQPVTPFLFVSSQVPPTKLNNQTTYRPIAPKDPTKHTEAACQNGVVKHPQVSNNVLPKSSQTCDKSTGSGQPTNEPPTSPPGQGKKATEIDSDKKYLNLARRVVAEMKKEDLTITDDDDLDTYLHMAVISADKSLVQALLERLTREKLTNFINAQNRQQQTPLHLAVCLNEPDKVRVLVQYQADANILAEAQKSSGCMEKVGAIHCASTNGAGSYETLTELLKSPSIDPNLVNSDGHTALICAILAHGKVDSKETKINSIPIIQLLVRAGADLNFQVPQSGKTSLMYALESRDLDLIEGIFKLVEHSKMADVLKKQAFDKSTCLKIAESLKASLDPVGQQRLASCLSPVGHKMS